MDALDLRMPEEVRLIQEVIMLADSLGYTGGSGLRAICLKADDLTSFDSYSYHIFEI